MKGTTDNNEENCDTNTQRKNSCKDYFNDEYNFFLCESKFRIVRYNICNCWHTHVNHRELCRTQACHNIILYHPWYNNSFYNNLLNQLTKIIDEHSVEDDTLNTNCIIICSECKIPSNRHDSTEHNIFRDHPNYKPGQYWDKNESYNSSWHNWVEV